MKKKIIAIGIIGMFLIIIISTIPITGAYLHPQSLTQSQSTTTDWWTMIRHDEAQTGRSTSESPDTENLLWNKKIDIDNINFYVFYPLIYNGKIYISTDEIVEAYPFLLMISKVYCINSEDGSKEWSRIVAGPKISGAGSIGNAIYNNELFVFTYEFKMFPFGVDGNLKVLNPDNGDIIRDKKFNDEILIWPYINDDKIYIGTKDFIYETDGKLYCLDLNGNVEWSFQVTNNKLFYPPAIANNRVYVSSDGSSGIIFCLDALNDGEVIWQSHACGEASNLAYDDGKIYAVGLRKVRCFNADNGEELWAQEISNPIMTSEPAIFNNMVYIASQRNDGKIFLYCVDENGIVWSSEPLYGDDFSSPIVADEKVFLGTGEIGGSGKFYCFEANTGDPKWDSEIRKDSSYGIANKKIHVVTFDSSIYTYNVLASNNNPPNIPSISGSLKGNVGEEYEYTFVAIDPEEDDVCYYVEWGDDTSSGWTDFVASGTEITLTHTWEERGTYTIRAKAKDICGAESGWGTLEVTMPRNKIAHNTLFLNFLQQHPNLFPILRQLLQRLGLQY